MTLAAWHGMACPNPAPQGAWGGKRSGKRGRDASSGGEEEEAGRKPENVYLILKGGRQKSAEYRWALVCGLSLSVKQRTESNLMLALGGGRCAQALVRTCLAINRSHSY